MRHRQWSLCGRSEGRGLGAAVCALIAIITVWTALVGSPAAAQEQFLFVRNRGNPTLFLGVNAGLPAALPLDQSALSSQWVLEPVPDEPVMRIKNREQNTYLHTQNGALELSDIQP